MKKDEYCSLYQKLVEYTKDEVYPLHMPGHKRNTGLIPSVLPYAIDITEIHGFDNLNQPEDILKECQERASRLYQSEESYYLVNGSTCGILAGIRACCSYGDKIIMARNCHKAVYHGVELNGLQSVYLIPPMDKEYGIYGSITSKQVREQIEVNQDAKLIVITSPTYEGIISNIREICEVAHEYHIPVLVDEAHGAHLGFHKEFASSSVTLGADIVIHSLHKTLPALTQCAMAHRNGTLVSKKRLEKELAIFQSSSPSYVLMASIDQCIELLYEKKEELFTNHFNYLQRFSEKLMKLKRIKVLCKGMDENKNHPNIYGLDIGKIIIKTSGICMSGQQFSSLLRGHYHMELEMASSDYVVAMTSIGDKKETLEQLAYALQDIDKKFDDIASERDITIELGELIKEKPINYQLPKNVMSISKAFEMNGTMTSYEKLIGCISKEYIWAYPPGIPLLVPGEIITRELLLYFQDIQKLDVKLSSTERFFPIQLNVYFL